MPTQSKKNETTDLTHEWSQALHLPTAQIPALLKTDRDAILQHATLLSKLAEGMIENTEKKKQGLAVKTALGIGSTVKTLLKDLSSDTSSESPLTDPQLETLREIIGRFSKLLKGVEIVAGFTEKNTYHKTPSEKLRDLICNIEGFISVEEEKSETATANTGKAEDIESILTRVPEPTGKNYDERLAWLLSNLKNEDEIKAVVTYYREQGKYPSYFGGYISEFASGSTKEYWNNAVASYAEEWKREQQPIYDQLVKEQLKRLETDSLDELLATPVVDEIDLNTVSNVGYLNPKMQEQANTTGRPCAGSWGSNGVWKIAFPGDPEGLLAERTKYLDNLERPKKLETIKAIQEMMALPFKCQITFTPEFKEFLFKVGTEKGAHKLGRISRVLHSFQGGDAILKAITDLVSESGITLSEEEIEAAAKFDSAID